MHIIDHSKSLSWKQKMFSKGTTGILWVLWLKMVFIGSIVWLHSHYIGLSSGINALELFLEIVAAVWILGFLPRDKTNFAGTFPLKVEYSEFKNSKIVVIHHDEHGNIVKVESK